MERALTLPDDPTVATISLSSGAANDFPDQYKLGKREIQRSLNAEVIETPNATKPDEWLHNHPEKRLNDLVWAFNNDEVDAVISNIGGDDSIRLLNHVTDDDKTTLSRSSASPTQRRSPCSSTASAYHHTTGQASCTGSANTVAYTNTPSKCS